MARNYESFGDEQLQANLDSLRENPYPGRGIVQGLSADGEVYLQAYWVMGRSENSRNRVLECKDGVVSTKPFDAEKVEDPSLIIYPAMRSTYSHNIHVVSNGAQTDAPVDYWDSRGSRDDTLSEFGYSLRDYEFEPDSPNYTPRITGYITQAGEAGHSIIRRDKLTGKSTQLLGKVALDKLPKGTGLCLHTYEGDGDPLPSFEGTPYAVPVGSRVQDTAKMLWDCLNQENRVALAVRAIDSRSGVWQLRIVNQLIADDI